MQRIIEILKTIGNLPRHVAKINDELGELAQRVKQLEEFSRSKLERLAKVETDLVWVKWMTMAILGGIVALLIRVFIVPTI